MATTKLSDEAFLAFLEKHPDLRDRFASIVGAVENSEGNLEKADTAEERIIEEMRNLGREAMQGWAERQVEVTEQEIRQQPQMHRQGKKLRWHTKLGEIAVLEPRYRLESKSVRPFLRSAKVIPRGCSRALQRAITD
ncbi:MAG: ISKra4 family transposase, partial [Roseiarcus sp.]